MPDQLPTKMDAYSNEKRDKAQEMIGGVDVSCYISDHDSIHEYNDGYDSDTSNGESQSDQNSETDEEENSTLDEDEYATFKNRIKTKRGRSIGLSFKPNGYLIPNRQLAYLLRARKLVLYGPFSADELNAPLGESNFCPSLQDVLWRSSGLKFHANGRATLSLKDPLLKRALSAAATTKSEGSDENKTSISREYLRRLGISFDSNGAIIRNTTFKTLLDSGKIVLDKSTHDYTLPCPANTNEGAYFGSRFAKPYMFFVSRPTSEIVLGLDQQQNSWRRGLQKGLSKPNGIGESEIDEIISGIGFMPVNDNDLEILGSTRFIISLNDLVFAMADEKKLLSCRPPHNHSPPTLLGSLLSTLQNSDNCKHLCRNSAIDSEKNDSKFATKNTDDLWSDSESDPNILNTVAFEETSNLIQKFETTINQACPGLQNDARPKFRPKRSRLRPQSTISLPPWNSIKFTYSPVGLIPAKLRRVDKVLVKVNKRAIMIIDIFNKSSNILGGSKKMYLPLVFRCWLRAKIVA